MHARKSRFRIALRQIRSLESSHRNRACQLETRSGRGRHRTAESQDGFVFSFVHSTICEPDRRVRVSAIRFSGHVVSFSEHLRRLDRDCAGGTARSSHSFLREFPATAKNGHRGDHDRTGNLSGDQREQVRSRAKTRRASQGRAGPVSQLQNLMIVAVELDGVVELVQ